MYKHTVTKPEPFHIGTQRSRLICDQYTESYRPKKYKHAATETEVYKHTVAKPEPFHIGTQRSRLICDQYTESYRPKKYKHAATETEVYTLLTCTSCGTI